VVLIDSVSKRYSECGIRIGALITKNKEIRDAVMKFCQARLSPPLIGQIAAEASLDAPEEYSRETYDEYVERRKCLIDGLNRIPGVYSPIPMGAFYTVAKLPVDDSDKSPGWKFSESEMRGIPVRVEIGPKDMEQNQAVLVRRDTHEKQMVPLDELKERIGELLGQIQKEMLERARVHRDAHTYTATDFDAFKETVEEKPGFVKAMWCGSRECEDKIKELTGATSRCMPFAQEKLADTCVCCKKPAVKMVYWGKAY
jgi:hypothetical protein